MALDAALLEAVRAGGPPVLRFYRWEPACLSLGRNQPARGAYALDALAARGIGVVRRPTGGRAVLHEKELTYSVVVPLGLLGGPRETYTTINRALLRGLRRLGVAAALQPRSGQRAPRPSLLPCFAEPAEGELVVAGRKLVGSAQYCERGAILQHGSLLLEPPVATLPGLLHNPASAPPSLEPATLDSLLQPLPAWECLTAALAAGCREQTRLDLEPTTLTPALNARAAELTAHFADSAWTWRR